MWSQPEGDLVSMKEIFHHSDYILDALAEEMRAETMMGL